MLRSLEARFEMDRDVQIQLEQSLREIVRDFEPELVVIAVFVAAGLLLLFDFIDQQE